jgi:hypothetical protein
MMRTGCQRIAADAATAVAPLAVALALGAAIAHADTYAERGGGGSKRLARNKIQTREELAKELGLGRATIYPRLRCGLVRRA